uniref:C-type lectin domain-containing protein n=1 Tax=Acrobeloides nanus TaxID=290746 RepID=A0A914CFE8_9BILA
MLFYILLLLFSACDGCPTGTIQGIASDSCYKSYISPQNFFIAEETCFVNEGGHLASVHDAFTNAFLMKEASSLFNADDYWASITPTKTIPTGSPTQMTPTTNNITQCYAYNPLVFDARWWCASSSCQSEYCYTGDYTNYRFNNLIQQLVIDFNGPTYSTGYPVNTIIFLGELGDPSLISNVSLDGIKTLSSGDNRAILVQLNNKELNTNSTKILADAGMTIIPWDFHFDRLIMAIRQAMSCFQL